MNTTIDAFRAMVEPYNHLPNYPLMIRLILGGFALIFLGLSILFAYKEMKEQKNSQKIKHNQRSDRLNDDTAISDLKELSDS